MANFSLTKATQDKFGTQRGGFDRTQMAAAMMSNIQDTFENPNTVELIPVDMLIPFHGHIFEINEQKVNDLQESIEKQGIITPLIVRRYENGYEIIAGHHRYEVAKRLGIEEVPCIVKDVDDVEAELMMIHTNFQRGLEELKPSEIGKALNRSFELEKRQGKRSDLDTSGTIHNSNEKLAKENGLSTASIYRYRRIAFLVPDLQKKVDDNSISLQAGVELSFLAQEQQENLSALMEQANRFVTIEESKALKDNRDSDRFKDQLSNLFQENTSGEDTAATPSDTKLKKPKKQQRIVKIPMESIEEYIPSEIDPNDLKEVGCWIIETLEKQKSQLDKPTALNTDVGVTYDSEEDDAYIG